MWGNFYSYMIPFSPVWKTRRIMWIRRCFHSLGRTAFVESSWNLVTTLKGIISWPKSITSSIAQGTPGLLPLNERVMVKILNYCILSILVYNLFLDRQRNILYTAIFPYTGILAVFMKFRKFKKYSCLIGRKK